MAHSIIEIRKDKGGILYRSHKNPEAPSCIDGTSGFLTFINLIAIEQQAAFSSDQDKM